MTLAENNRRSHRRTDLAGSLAFACVVVACFSEFWFVDRINGSTAQVVLTFVLGAVYLLTALLGPGVCPTDNRAWDTGLYLFQCTVVTVLMFVSPVQGFFGIIILPMVSQAYFDFKWAGAIAATIYLFGVCLAVAWYHFGMRAVPETAISFLAAFVFTIAFTVITRQAILARDRAEKLRLEVESANEHLRAHAAQTADLATTRERNRLAREIHDGVGHYLTVVKTQLDAAAAILPSQPEKAREAILKAAKLTGEALDDVRRSVGALRTDTDRPPLPEALRALTLDAGLPVTVRIAGSARPLPPGLEHALFRSAQEGLTNIRKHAGASTAELALDFNSAGHVTLALTDNGRGASGGAPPGYGLLGIRERITVLGGRVEAGNRPGGGFALTVEVPA